MFLSRDSVTAGFSVSLILILQVEQPDNRAKTDEKKETRHAIADSGPAASFNLALAEVGPQNQTGIGCLFDNWPSVC